MQPKKRFIAGARCPQCQAVDRVMMLTLPDQEWIECVDCGHREDRPTVDGAAAAALDASGPAVVEPASGIVKFKSPR